MKYPTINECLVQMEHVNYRFIIPLLTLKAPNN